MMWVLRKLSQAGVQRRSTVASAINEETGTVNVFELLPDAGDSIMIINCGDHFELRHHKWNSLPHPPLHLTEHDIELLKAGHITWN
jgi:hypothetical protein